MVIGFRCLLRHGRRASGASGRSSQRREPGRQELSICLFGCQDLSLDCMSYLLFRKEISGLFPFDRCLLGGRSASELRTWGHLSPCFTAALLCISACFASSRSRRWRELVLHQQCPPEWPGMVRCHSDRITGGLLTISTSAAAPEGEKALRANDPASNAAAKQGNSDRLVSLRIQLPAWTASSYYMCQLSGPSQTANTRLTTITGV